jgi:hypothetical protein
MLRYGSEAWLARTYGESAARFMEERATGFFWPMLGGIVAIALVWWLWRRFRKPPAAGLPRADVE